LTTLRTLTSSRSSASETCSASQTVANCRRSLARPAWIRMLASVTRRAKRSGRIAVSRLAIGSATSSASPAGRMAARSSSPVWRSCSSSTRSATSATSSAEVALDLPGDALGDPDLGLAGGLAELPVGARGVGARVEIGGALEVVLGLGRVGDLAADAREAEDADRVALVRAAQEVELTALEEQVIRVDLAGADLVALHRVVVEGDRLVAEDRRLDLREALGEVVAAGAGGDAEGDRALVGRVERAGAAPGDLLQGQAQRLGVGELAVEQRQRELEPGELLVGEGDRGQVEVLGPQRVVLLLGHAVGGLLDRELDAERVQLGAIGVEAAGEGVLVHAAVALDVAPDLQRGDRTAFRHEIRDERELTDELLGVLRHIQTTIRPLTPGWAVPCRSPRALSADSVPGRCEP